MKFSNCSSVAPVIAFSRSADFFKSMILPPAGRFHDNCISIEISYLHHCQCCFKNANTVSLKNVGFEACMECVPLGTIIGAGISGLHCRKTVMISPYIFGLCSPVSSRIGKLNFWIFAQLIFPLSPLSVPLQMLSRMICFTTGGNFSQVPGPL